MDSTFDIVRSKVSAIISAYYCADYLEGRIRNLLNQTLVPEIVVVAKYGSPEHAIADRLLQGPPHFKRVTPEIPTIYDAWNRGIEASTGEYITNANADDRLAPHAIESLAAALDSSDAAVAYANVDIVEDLAGGFDAAWRTGHFRWLAPLPHAQHEALLQTCYLGPQPMWRRSLHEKYGYFDPEFQSAGDYEFWLRLAAGGEHFTKINEVLGIYLRREDQAEQRFNRNGVAQKETLEARRRYAL